MNWILVTLYVHRLKIQGMEVLKLCTVLKTTRLLIPFIFLLCVCINGGEILKGWAF